MKSILLIRYSALGDVVLATSVLAGLRQKFPSARIEWVTDGAYATLLEGVVDRVISFARRDAVSRAAVLQDVRGRFDLAIDLQNKWWSNSVARAAAPKRLRFVRRTPFEALASLVGHDKIFDDLPATELYARAAQLEQSGPPYLVASQAARERAASLLPGENWVAVSPGAAWENKRWPAARLAQVAAGLRSKGHRIVLVGGPMDGALLDTVRSGCTLDADLTSESLAVVSAALGRVRLLIGNDSGLVHVAAAMGTTVLALFGPTSVIRWGPRPPGEALSLGLACSPCSNHGGHSCPLGHHDCLQKLEVSAVQAQANKLLSAGDAPRRSDHSEG